MKLNLITKTDKSTVFEQVQNFLDQHSLSVHHHDQTRPWGGFYAIDEADAEKFISLFFKDVTFGNEKSQLKVSPKILIVAPEKRLSWQYHFRRSEVWKVIHGVAGIMLSDSDEPGDVEIKNTGEIISIAQGQRHRLIGLEDWSILAEIWQHTDANHPSNEEDIVRVEDDFGRN